MTYEKEQPGPIAREFRERIAFCVKTVSNAYAVMKWAQFIIENCATRL